MFQFHGHSFISLVKVFLALTYFSTSLSCFEHTSMCITCPSSNHILIPGLQPEQPGGYDSFNNMNPISPPSFQMQQYPNTPGFGGMDSDPYNQPGFVDFEPSTINIGDIGDILGIATSMNFSGGGSGMETN